MPGFKAVFFDLDGTLLDSKECIAQVASKTFEQLGLEPVSNGYFFGLLKQGLGMKHHLTEVAKRPELYPKAKEIFALKYSEIIEEIKPFPYTEELLETLEKKGIRTGIFTSQYAQLLKLTLERFPLRVDAAISRDDVQNGKPAPDQVKLLCERFAIRPSKALSVGDWTGDIEAGRRAGTRTAGVLTGLCTREELEMESPDYILENAAGVLDVV